MYWNWRKCDFGRTYKAPRSVNDAWYTQSPPTLSWNVLWQKTMVEPSRIHDLYTQMYRYKSERFFSIFRMFWHEWNKCYVYCNLLLNVSREIHRSTLQCDLYRSGKIIYSEYASRKNLKNLNFSKVSVPQDARKWYKVFQRSVEHFNAATLFNKRYSGRVEI